MGIQGKVIDRRRFVAGIAALGLTGGLCVRGAESGTPAHQSVPAVDDIALWQ